MIQRRAKSDCRRIAAIARKEFIQIRRDWRSLAIAIAIPMLMLFLYGYALSLDVDHVRMVVWDQDGSRAARDFVRDFDDSPYFRITKYVDGYAAIDDEINNGDALMALVIPVDFSKYLRGNQASPVQLIVDGSDSNTATIAMSYVVAVTEAHNRRLATATLQGAGISAPMPLDLKPRVWFNPDLKSKNYIIPGLIAVIMMVIAALLTSLTVAREWERGTMEQLIATPVRSHEIIIGKLIPYFAIGFFDVFIAVIMGEILFRVPLHGSVFLLFVLTAFFIAGTLSLGILISTLARNQLLASQVAMVATFLPAFLLSGFVFAISNMPVAIQVITRIVPARYFVVILKGIYLKGVGLSVLWMQAMFLAIFAVIAVALANLKFRKKVE